MSDRTDARLVRMLGIVTYLDRVGESTVDHLAARFEVTAGQIAQDIDTLWVSGLPGYWPQDLLDFDAAALENGIVRITETHGLERPLRLGAREAIALGAALRTLQAVTQQLTDDPDVEHVLAGTLTALTAAHRDASTAFDVTLEQTSRPTLLATIRAAQAARHALELTYADANDVTGTRTILPLSLSSGDGHTYVDAWALDSGAHRTYRLDRVLAVEPSDRPVPDVLPDDPMDRTRATSHPFTQAGMMITITLRSGARVVAETVPYETLQQHDDGSFTLVLRVANLPWLDHLVLEHVADVLGLSDPDVAGRVQARAADALAAYHEAGLAG